MIIPVKTENGSYNIYLCRGGLDRVGEYFNLERRVLIVTDNGVPEKYAKTVAAHCKEPLVVTVKAGERSKSIENYTLLLKALVEGGFTRTDCVVAVGGGVVGDLAGFVASTFMRGVDFYNVPTTLLSQVDSSIGGKTAIDFLDYKNIVGAFYQPKGVLIDPLTLSTLPERQLKNGLAEALKMSMTSDPVLFSIFENGDPIASVDSVIERSLLVKKSVVEEDEKESGLRKILNFGHTLAHAVESADKEKALYHGECVAIGMVPMCAPSVRERLLPILKKLSLPSESPFGADELLPYCRHDKKAAGDKLTIVYVPEIGRFELRTVTFSEFENLVKESLS